MLIFKCDYCKTEWKNVVFANTANYLQLEYMDGTTRCIIPSGFKYCNKCQGILDEVGRKADAKARAEMLKEPQS